MKLVMTDSGATTHRNLGPVAEAALSLLDAPAALVACGQEIIAHNALWREATGGQDDPALEHSLRGYSSAESVLAALRAGSPATGAIVSMQNGACGADGVPLQRSWTVRWRQVRKDAADRTLAVIVLHDASDVDRLASIVSTQHTRINRLLLRQTIVEEAERRRLGRALHDGVAQDLAQLRAALKGGGPETGASPRLIALLDRAIDEVRTLSFDLSPPILEDLGLLPALRWLGDHLGQRYGTRIAVTDDGKEPRLTNEGRIILFRAIRELAVNAAKHAHGSVITINCATVGPAARITVSDTGPGFDLADLYGAARREPLHYGLLSVEQQIRGMAGAFQLTSDPAEGTTAVITIPSEHGQEARDV